MNRRAIIPKDNEDFATRMLRIEFMVDDYKEGIADYARWYSEWRERQPKPSPVWHTDEGIDGHFP